MSTLAGPVVDPTRHRAGRTVKALVAAGALLAACTPVTWTRADADSIATRGDSAECRQLAGSEAWRQAWERDWPPAFYDGRYMPPYYRWPRPFWHQYATSLELEQDLYEFCMHSKGYHRSELVD